MATTKFWIKTGILMGEAVLGMIAKGMIAVAILNLIFVQRKLNASCIYMLDKTVGDFLYLVTWAIPTIMEERFHNGWQNTNDTSVTVDNSGFNNNNNVSSLLCPSTFLFPMKIFNTITFVHSVAILSFMSIQRCRCIIKPFSYLSSTWTSRKRAVINVLALWTLSAMVGASIKCCYTFLMCRLERPLPVIIQTIFSVVTYVIPLTIIFGSYLTAIQRLRKSIKSDRMIKNDVMVKKRQNLAIKMLYLVAIFGLCWLAYNVAAIAKYAIDPANRLNPVLEWFTFVADVIALSNFTLNPLALMILNVTILNSLKCWQTKSVTPQRGSVPTDTDNVQIYNGPAAKARSSSVETVRTDLLEE